MKEYEITLDGRTPFLSHADDIEWADRMEAWRNDPAHQKTSRAGDDRSPANRWIGNLYHDGVVVGVPNDNLMRAFMEAGAMVPVPGAKSRKTFKSQTQSGMLVVGTHWPLLIGEHAQTVPIAKVHTLLPEKEFSAHQAYVESLGFSLFVKRVRIGTSKHIRVRPRFDRWRAVGQVNVWDEQITTAVLKDVCAYAGSYKGLGDWRPGSRTPGSFGMFSATVKEI